MSARSSSSSYGLRSLATILVCRNRISSRTTTNGHHYCGYGTTFSKIHNGLDTSTNQAISVSSGNTVEVQEKGNVQKDTIKVQPFEPIPTPVPAPALRGPDIFSWAKWLFGSILPLLFSFWKQKWDNMLMLEGKVEKLVEEAEEVAEVVEKVAATTEKLSAQVAEKLDNGELKEAALMVQHISSVTAKDARITQDFIHKVGDLKQDLKTMETMVEPVIDKIENRM